MYVGEEHGSPLLSGTQALQATLINLQFLHSSALSNADRYTLKEGWIVYQADGRAEEALGQPAVVTKDRNGWLASGHVGRIIPRNERDAGWIYLALSTRHAQLQIKSLASGSVVDSTFPDDMSSVILPPRASTDGRKAYDAWQLMGEAATHEFNAIGQIDKLVGSIR